ncbi:MAG: isoprenylcysteine carboxylmethyltransferase family protein [Proteobacteria bacterium]|nr:isoprenylcysteine carboxylmethyltransferase family protein [Pseudomonadota bacterium]
MADALNKTRMRDTRILMVAALLAGVFGQTCFMPGTLAHKGLELAGYALVVVCAIGRVYASTFIGGIKNKELMVTGPYSICRNPLYLFSLLGAAGIGLVTTSLIISAVMIFGFLLIYISLIKREEEFLAKKFGKEFQDYSARVPRLWPSFKHYHCPAELTFQPAYLSNAIADAVWWFAALPLFEIADYLKLKGLIVPVINIF